MEEKSCGCHLNPCKVKGKWELEGTYMCENAYVMLPRLPGGADLHGGGHHWPYHVQDTTWWGWIKLQGCSKAEFSASFPGPVLSLKISSSPAEHGHFDSSLNQEFPVLGIPSSVQFSSVWSLSCVWLFVIPWTVTRQVSLSITNSWSLLNSCPSSR